MSLSAVEKYQRRFERTDKRYRCLTVQSQKTDVLRVFQRMVKLTYLRDDGTLECVTCGAIKPMNRTMNAGHFIPRRHNATCFLSTNCHPQCAFCNKELSGNLSKYREFMCETYGEDWVKHLEEEQHRKVTWTREEMVRKYLEFSDVIKRLERRKGMDRV